MVSRPAPQPLRFVVDIRRIERRANSSGSDLRTRSESWKGRISETLFFLTSRRKFALGAVVLSLAVFFAALPARADIITFYPTSCLGGWVNPERAQGQFSVLDKGDGEMIGDDTFTRENSAVLEGSAAQIFCGSFNADVPEDATVSGFTLIFSWDFRDPQSGLSLPSPLSVDGTDYAFKQAAVAATAFYSSDDRASTTTVAHATSTPVDVLPVATTTIVATDATSTANAILNLDTRQAAEVHIDLSTTTVVAEPQPEPQPQPSEPAAHTVEVIDPAANTAQVHNAVEAAAPEVVLPPVTDQAPVPSPEPVIESVPAPQSFSPLLIFASVFGTIVHAQEAEVPPAVPVEVPVVVPASTEQTPVNTASPAPSTPPMSPSSAPSSTGIEPVVPDPVVPQTPAAVAAPESEIPSPTPSPLIVSDIATTATATTAAATTSLTNVSIEATTTATSSQEQERTVAAQLSAIQDAPFLEVLYSIDGTTWRQLGTVSSQNWKYSRLALPITDWRDLEHLQISLQTMPVAGTMPSVYLDGLAVEANVLYSRKDPNPLPDLLADKLITQEVASSYRAALIRRVQDVGQVELWVSEVVDPRSQRVLSGKNALEAQLIQRALTSTTTSRFIRLSWRKVADATLAGEHTHLATYQRSLFWIDAQENSMWKYSLDSNSYESVSIDPITGSVEMDVVDEAGQVVRVTYNKNTKNFVFTHVSDEGHDED